jgi:hypothetical protein
MSENGLVRLGKDSEAHPLIKTGSKLLVGHVNNKINETALGKSQIDSLQKCIIGKKGS